MKLLNKEDSRQVNTTQNTWLRWLRFQFSSLIPHILLEHSRLLVTELVNIKVNPETIMETSSCSSYLVWNSYIVSNSVEGIQKA